MIPMLIITMIPILIVLGLLAVGVAIGAFATRRAPGATPAPVDLRTGWNVPMRPAHAVRTGDPFAHSPPPEPLVPGPTRTSGVHS